MIQSRISQKLQISTTWWVLPLAVFLCAGCKKAPETTDYPKLFTLLPSSHTGIDFRNDLSFTEKFNPYTFRNFFNGAGVALGDINNDGLIDIFLAGNQTPNRLYLNKGNFKFEDITQKAGLWVEGIWSTGVSMADINGDGFLDIYVCKSGPLEGDNRHNALYINNGDLTFSEQGQAFGIAEKGLSQHAVFFDYDRDGDLDMYLLNNSGRSIGLNDLREGQRAVRDPEGGNKLFRNDGGKFSDVSEKAGIYGSAIGYGLGVTAADLNRDGWPDLYVSNDFFERDYLYINNQDGTFSEVLESAMTEISMGSMGADIADLDNDGWQDIFVTEMLPATWDRVKTKTPFEDWDKYQANIKAGYFHQFTRNTLQRNLGWKPGTKEAHFVDIARFSGVHATDWSWGALIFDADNDGLRDIFVANGIVKDLTDFDFVDYFEDKADLIQQYRRDSVLITKILEQAPSTPLQNYLFHNRGNFQFENIAAQSGMEQLTFSTGAAYADFNNDGALDLVVNNLNGEVYLYQNNSPQISKRNFLQLDLQGNYGALVQVFVGKQMILAENNPVKGYMSSVDQRVHIGLDTLKLVDSIWVDWPHGKRSVLKSVAANQVLKINPAEANITTPALMIAPTFLSSTPSLSWKHEESSFVDFDRDRLRFQMASNEGPRIAVADLNGDGWDDLFLPGAKGQASTIWMQDAKGNFRETQVLEKSAEPEDVEGLFFDANADGRLDLYVVSGSLEFNYLNPLYQDRLYLNDGNGKLQLSPKSLPQRFESSAFVRVLDFNKDGKPDLLVGTRTIPFAYGVGGDLVMLENQGNGSFLDKTTALAPGFKGLGMARDAWTGDLDGDGHIEIVVVGDWMPIHIFSERQGKFVETSVEMGFEKTGGFWNCILAGDWNADGKTDLLFGNLGTNTRLQASADKPLRMYVNDFDQNGSVEQIITQYEGDKAYPIVLKNTLLKQLPALRKNLLNYAAYKDKTIQDLFPEDLLQRSKIWEVHTLESRMYIQGGNATFASVKIPEVLQYSAVYAFHAESDSDGQLHLFAGGNQSRIKPELGIQMGSYGWHFILDKEGGFKHIPAAESGFFVSGEIRSLNTIRGPKGKYFAVARNNDTMLFFKMNEKPRLSK
jgi:enediyne biosynthesis protein E4